jgi:hypothetical protein
MKITIKKNEDMYFNPLGKTDRSTCFFLPFLIK